MRVEKSDDYLKSQQHEKKTLKSEKMQKINNSFTN